MARGSVIMRFGSNNKAVSPIIATILMVSVTVVLAGVLYVMIIGMGAGSGDLAPLGSWYASDITGNTSATYIFGGFSYEIKPIDIKIIIEEGDNQTYTEFPGSLEDGFTTMKQ